MRVPLLLLTALASFAIACTGDDEHVPDRPDAGASADSAPVPTTATSFCTDLSERLCAGLSSCGCRFDLRPYDAAGCVAARSAECLGGFGARVEPDVAAGRARFHEPGVSACLDAVEVMASACVLSHDSSDALPEECFKVVVSTAAVGATCQLSSGGLAFCGADANGVCVPGEASALCTALPGAQAACFNGLCATGLVCNAELCAAPAASGSACSDGHACQDGLVCDPMGQCAAPLAARATCTDSAQCQPGLACDGGACTSLAELGDGCSASPSLVCGVGRDCGRAPETRTCTDPDAEGALCMDSTCAGELTCAIASMTCVALPGDTETCLDGFACADGLTCVDLTGTCAPLPGMGETCAAGNRFCADGLGCRTSDNTCQPGPGAGQACYLNPPDSVCGAGLGCDFAANGSVCIPIGGAGAACNTDRTCASGTYCDGATMQCANKLSAGAACSADNECQAGHECPFRPGVPGLTCQPIPTRDQACSDDCADDLACKGPGGMCVPELCVVP